MTSAPKSLKIIPQKGAGASPAISITLIPFNAIFKNCFIKILLDENHFKIYLLTIEAQKLNYADKIL